MSSKLVVAQPIHNNVLSYLEQHADVEMNPGPEPYGRSELIEKCADAHGVMVFMTERIDNRFLETCKNMKVISGALKGYNNINLYECSIVYNLFLIFIINDRTDALIGEKSVRRRPLHQGW